MVAKPIAIIAAVVIAAGAFIALPTAAHAAAAASCRSIPVDADPFLKSDAARTEFGIDGTGVKVGIISDSFAVNFPATPPLDPASPGVSTVDENVAGGLLPGAGNPCGYATPVTVLRDMPAAPPATVPIATDEGRAMAQMVHGVAPGAQLFFASAGVDLVDVPGAIDLLVAAGVDIIVDDVIGTDEAWFQQSLVAQHVDAAVRDHGITYFSAAGNNTVLATEPRTGQEVTPIGAWRTAAYRGAECEEPLNSELQQEFPGRTFDCLDFDPDPAVIDTEAEWTTYPNEMKFLGETYVGVEMTMQWGEPFGAAKAEFGVASTTNMGTHTFTIDTPGDAVVGVAAPYDLAGYTDAEIEALTLPLEVSIFRFTDLGPDTLTEPPVGIISTIDGYQWARSAEYWRSQGPDLVGRTVVGHNGAPLAVSVAAAGADIDGRINTFSSLGPVSYFLTPETNDGTATALTPPVTSAKPTILSIDGAGQTALYSAQETSPGVYIFDGTSAASPNAAAVAALALQLDPSLTPDDLQRLIRETATAVASPYATIPAADVVGAGLIDAQALTRRVHAALPVPVNPVERPVLAASGGTDASGVALLGAVLLLAGAGAVALRRRSATR